MFRTSLCPSSGDQDCVLPRMVLCTGCAGRSCVELERETCALCEGRTVSHSEHSSRSSSTQPRPAQPMRNTIRGSTRSYSPDDGHTDARNMLR